MKKYIFFVLLGTLFFSQAAFSATTPPLLISPVASSSYVSPFTVNYFLPQTPQSGTVKIVFTGSSTITLHMSDNASVSFSLNISDISSSSFNILSQTSNTIPAGVYDVSIAYQNASGDPEQSTVATNVYINATPPPSIAFSVSSSTFSPLAGIPLTYTIPTTPLAGSVLLSISNTDTNYAINLPDSSGTDLTTTFDVNGHVPDGTYTITLRYQDSLGNPAASASLSNVVLLTPTVSIADVSATESATSVDVDVTLNGLSTSSITVDYATSDGTATAGTDYTTTTGTLTWSAGETGIKSITVPLTTVSGASTSRTITLTLSNPSGVQLGTATGTITIPHTALPAAGTSCQLMPQMVSEHMDLNLFTIISFAIVGLLFFKRQASKLPSLK